MTVGILFLVGAAVALLIGAELLAEHAAAAGRRLGVTGLAVGLLLAGAEPEELITAVTAAARDRPGIAVGDAIGANVTMLTLALGLAALVAALPLKGRVRRYAAGAAITGGAAVAVLWDGRTSRAEGALLVVLYVALVAWVWRREGEPPAIGELAEGFDDDANDAEERPTVELALALGGIGVMAAGGAVAVEGAERIVAALSATDTAVGLTLVALATTAELLALVWAAARRHVSELAVAAIVGSAAYNATATLGAAAIVGPGAGLSIRAPVLMAAALPLVVLLLGGRSHTLGRAGGAILVAAYAVFVVLTLT